MKLKIKIAEVAGKHGFKSAYALQKALDCSPTMASRLWKGNFKQIGIETIESLCELFQCSPNDFLEYPLTLSGNTESSKNVERATQLSNTQSSKFEELKQNSPVVAANPADVVKQLSNSGNVKASDGRIVESNIIASDNETLLSTVEVAERLGVSRKSVNDYIIAGKLPAVKGKQNHNFIRESDLSAFVARK